MTTGYNNRRTNGGNSDGGIEWGITLAVLIFLLIITGLPSVAVGLIAWRLTPRTSWTWLLWLALALAGGYAVFFFYTHGLDLLLIKEWRDYYFALLTAHFDLRYLPWTRLWPETWPVWLRTLPAAGFTAFLQEVNTQMQPGQTARQLQQEERSRLRRIDRRAQRARRQARQPARVPDEAAGSMVVGVAIDDREQE